MTHVCQLDVKVVAWDAGFGFLVVDVGWSEAVSMVVRWTS
jgi:hypothetical protein